MEELVIISYYILKKKKKEDYKIVYTVLCFKSKKCIELEKNEKDKYQNVYAPLFLADGNRSVFRKKLRK